MAPLALLMVRTMLGAQGDRAYDGSDRADGNAHDRDDVDKALRKHWGVRSTRKGSHVQTFGHLNLFWKHSPELLETTARG